MIDKIAYAIMSELASAVNYFDKWTGLVKPMHKQVQNRERIFPVAINTPTTCDISDYTALVPDSTKKSVAYVEKLGETTVEVDRGSYRYLTDRLQIVVWYNLDLITSSKYISESEMAIRTAAFIPKTIADMLTYGAKKIRIEIESVDYGIDAVSQYTYDDVKTQYGIFPYGMFAITINVSYVGLTCITPIDLGAGCGGGKGNVENYAETDLTVDLITYSVDSDLITADQTLI